MPATGLLHRLGCLVQQRFGPPRVLLSGKDHEEIDSCADQRRFERDTMRELPRVEGPHHGAREISETQQRRYGHRRGSRQQWKGAAGPPEGKRFVEYPQGFVKSTGT